MSYDTGNTKQRAAGGRKKRKPTHFRGTSCARNGLVSAARLVVDAILFCLSLAIFVAIIRRMSIGTPSVELFL